MIVISYVRYITYIFTKICCQWSRYEAWTPWETSWEQFYQIVKGMMQQQLYEWNLNTNIITKAEQETIWALVPDIESKSGTNQSGFIIHLGVGGCVGVHVCVWVCVGVCVGACMHRHTHYVWKITSKKEEIYIGSLASNPYVLIVLQTASGIKMYPSSLRIPSASAPFSPAVPYATKQPG